MQLRPYQEKCIGQVFQSWNQYRKTLIVLPTGGGKTIIFANIASKATGRTLIIAHREELLQQAIDKIKQSLQINRGSGGAPASGGAQTAQTDLEKVLGQIFGRRA